MRRRSGSWRALSRRPSVRLRSSCARAARSPSTPGSSTAGFPRSRPGSASRASATSTPRTRTFPRTRSSWASRPCARPSCGSESLVPRALFSSPLAEQLAEDVLERFLRYVRVDTQAAYRTEARPSTEKQLDLSRLLVDELRELGLTDAELNEGHTVFATLPGMVDAPVIGLIAHVDTTPDVSGANVSPIVHEAWGGEPIVLPGDPRQVLDPAALPALAARVGHDVVTS